MVIRERAGYCCMQEDPKSRVFSKMTLSRFWLSGCLLGQARQRFKADRPILNLTNGTLLWSLIRRYLHMKDVSDVLLLAAISDPSLGLSSGQLDPFFGQFFFRAEGLGPRLK